MSLAHDTCRECGADRQDDGSCYCGGHGPEPPPPELARWRAPVRQALGLTPVGTLYHRAIKRVTRRAATYQARVRAGHVYQRHEAHNLLRQAVRTANSLARLAYGPWPDVLPDRIDGGAIDPRDVRS